MEKINIFWFRRDLRLRDNIGLYNSLSSDKTLLLFIYDDSILRNLKKDDPRVTFISSLINNINKKIEKFKSNVLCKYGNPIDIWKELISEYEISNVFFNRDYEPYAIKRDQEIIDLLAKNNIKTSTYKDHLIFEKNEISKADGNPYTVYTPYKNKWISTISSDNIKYYDSEKKLKNLYQINKKTINLEDFGFKKSSIKVINPNFDFIKDYEKFRDFPSENKTSFLSPHLRFGSIENELNGVKITSTSPPDGNSYTSGLTTDVTFEKIFINPSYTTSLIIETYIESELQDQIRFTDSTQIFCPSSLYEMKDLQKVSEYFNILGKRNNNRKYSIKTTIENKKILVIHE